MWEVDVNNRIFLPEKLTGLVRDNNRQTYDDYALRILGNASNGTYFPLLIQKEEISENGDGTSDEEKQMSESENEAEEQSGSERDSTEQSEDEEEMLE